MDPGPDTPRDDDDNNDGVATNSKELSKLVAVGAAPAPETEEEFPGHPDIAPSVTKSFNIRRSFENMDMLTGGQKNAGGGSSHFFDAINNARLALLDSEKMVALSNEPARDEDEGGDALYSLEKTKSGQFPLHTHSQSPSLIIHLPSF